MRNILLVALATLLPLAASSSSIEVVGPQPLHEGIDEVILDRSRALFIEGLRQEGAEVAGENREFIATLSLQRASDSWHLTARVSRWKPDRWSAVSKAASEGSSDGALAGAIDRLAREIARQVLQAPARLAGAPPPRSPIDEVSIAPAEERAPAAEEETLTAEEEAPTADVAPTTEAPAQQGL